MQTVPERGREIRLIQTEGSLSVYAGILLRCGIILVSHQHILMGTECFSVISILQNLCNPLTIWLFNSLMSHSDTFSGVQPGLL